MKRIYKKPKAILVDFHYDEKVTASSIGGGHYVEYGHSSVGRCQYTSGTACTNIFNPAHGALCDWAVPWSGRS